MERDASKPKTRHSSRSNMGVPGSRYLLIESDQNISSIRSANDFDEAYFLAGATKTPDHSITKLQEAEKSTNWKSWYEGIKLELLALAKTNTFAPLNAEAKKLLNDGTIQIHGT